VCELSGLFQTGQTIKNHLKKHGHARRRRLSHGEPLQAQLINNSDTTSDVSPELEQLDFSADNACSASYIDHPSGSSSPPPYFPSSDDDNDNDMFEQQYTPPRSSSPPLYLHSSDDQNTSLSDDNRTSVLSLTLNTDTRNHAADNDESYSDTSDELSHSEHVDDQDNWVPEDDPQFLPNDVLFDENTLADLDEPDGVLPPALSEHRALLNGYVHVFANAACRRATHADAEETLNLLHSTITSCYPGGISPELQGDLDNMARTLRTVEKRLGVDTGKIILNYILCPSCWHMYHPSELPTMQSRLCTASGCSAALFRLKRMSSKTQKRIPYKVMPVASFKAALERLLMRPAKWEELQHWRKDGDQEPAPPITREEWYAEKDVNEPLTDIYDGWMWRSLRTGMVRQWDSKKLKVNDIDVNKLNQRFVSLECGLIVHINIDWYVINKSSLQFTDLVIDTGSVHSNVLIIPLGLSG
jgi:hypothetical protein